MFRPLLTALVMGLAVAGCSGGGDDETLLDGAIAPDAGGDGGPDDCLAEADDGGNGDTAEPTGATYAGSRIALCGNVDIDHASGDLIDLDLYQLTVAPSAQVVVRLTAPLGAEVERLEVFVRDTGGKRARARVRAGNAFTALLLPQGEYTLGVEARAAEATVPIPYRLELYADEPSQRCPVMTGGSPLNEDDESGAGHRANDMIEVRDPPPIVATQATASKSDAPHATGEAVTAGGRFTLAGRSAAVASDGDDYRDRDTFSFYTGATTNQLDIRTTWTGGIADLDVLVFEAGKAGEPMGNPAAAVIGEEIVITSVEPSTAYWLWVGGSTRSTQLPVTYVIDVCGREIAAAPAAD